VEQRFGSTVVGGGADVVYSLTGSGPFLVVPPPWVSHLELAWAMPPERRFWEALAEHRTVVRYDKPGTGMSSRTPREPSLQGEMELLGAVADAVGAQRFELLGTSMAGAICAAWAADNPHRVDRLVIYGGWARGADIAAPAVRDHVVGIVAAHWGLGSEVLADIFIPEAHPQVKAALVHYQRESAPAELAASILRFGYDVDVVDRLGRITAPTLVIHREGDRAVPAEHGAFVAGAIAGAQLRVVPGRSHLAWAGDQDAVLAEIRRFLGLPASRRSRNATVTRRQAEVIALVSEGLSNRAIADRLGIEERSVEGHLDRIRDRLDLRSRAALAAWWVASNGS
jgi:pimeloyl-ACP methyl ester carboxylesterase/DNA-binding CsgD family transcriptional regulator